MMDQLLKRERDRLRLAVYFARQFMEELGQERALEIIGKAWARYGADNWRARLRGIPPEEVLPAMGKWFKAQAEVWPGLRVIEATPERLRVEITRCLTYDVCKEMGVPEVCGKYCDSDYGVIPVMYPHIKLVRDKEIAHGADRCNHCWIVRQQTERK